MANKKRRRSVKIGLSPGSMIHIGDQKVETVQMEVLDYNAEVCKTSPIQKVEEIVSFKESQTVSWLNINGLHDVDLIQKVGNVFDVHPLILEDILNTDQRPKLEIYDTYLFAVLKMITFEKSSRKLRHEQISLILGKNYVITFQENGADIFNPLRERIIQYKGRIRKQGADYLLYALMDVIIDNYFLALEEIGDLIEELENRVLAHPEKAVVEQIHRLKNELLSFRRVIWPLREVISNLIRDETLLIQSSTDPFLKDLYDHTVHVADSVDTFRDMVSGLLDVYLSNISNHMNEVMKVLTIIATIFIPLSFIAGIYGMNFEFMPELTWRWAYFALWGLIIGIASLMLYYFRKKGWF